MNIGTKKRPDHRGNNKYYQSKQHKTWREKVLKKSKGLCVHCLAPEIKNKDGQLGTIYRKAIVGDHIIPINAGGSEDDINNGQGLCKYHDSVKTAHDRKYYE